MEPKPFPNCPSLDGYHCQTNLLAKIFYFHGHQISEDKAEDLTDRIIKASEHFKTIAQIEEEALNELSEAGSI